MSVKNSSDTIGNRTRDVPVYSAVPQLTAPPRAPVVMTPTTKMFAVEPASVTPSYKHSNDDASQHKMVISDPALTTAETWLGFLSTLTAVIALDVSFRPQIIITIIVYRSTFFHLLYVFLFLRIVFMFLSAPPNHLCLGEF
jgi:hypothetical protein